MPAPIPGTTIPGAYVYQVENGVSVGGVQTATAAALLTSTTGSTVTFGGVTGAETVSYTLVGGVVPISQSISTSNDYQSASAFTFTTTTLDVTTTYIVSKVPIQTLTPSGDSTVGTLTALNGGLPDIGLAAGATTFIACYAAGTAILTDGGEVPVEALKIGDHVRTASGSLRPIKWIGQRSYAARFVRAHAHLQPIRFRAGSLGNGLPHRDLLVSPLHAMFLDGVLVPASALVNGTTIVRESAHGPVKYFHVELESHDVLLAEGAASESYVDDDSRAMFHNAAEFWALYPEVTAPGEFCAERVEQGAELEAIRRRLAAIAVETAVAA